jgi:membrane protease YdiL (CAAX protease family)
MMLASLRFADDLWRERLFSILPSNADERVIWFGVCAAAAICEETAYRGVLFHLLSTGFGGWWVPAIVTSLCFALAHVVQGWKSTLVVGLFGLAFQYLVLLTGSLYLAMLVHFLYDLIVGWYLSYRIPAEPKPNDDATV